MFTTTIQLVDFLKFCCLKRDSGILSQRKQYLLSSQNFQVAAVLVLIDTQTSMPQVWLTQRSTQLRHHSGQIAFPGGKHEEQDKSLIHTALREAQEELGTTLNQLQIIGSIQPCYLPSQFIVTPVLAFNKHKLSWHPNSAEVSDTFAVPLSTVLDKNAYQPDLIQWHQKQLTLYKLPYQHYVIWGATASILYHLAECYTDWSILQPHQNKQ